MSNSKGKNYSKQLITDPDPDPGAPKTCSISFSFFQTIMAHTIFPFELQEILRG
jgi:hypothetical protein